VFCKDNASRVKHKISLLIFIAETQPIFILNKDFDWVSSVIFFRDHAEVWA